MHDGDITLPFGMLVAQFICFMIQWGRLTMFEECFMFESCIYIFLLVQCRGKKSCILIL